MYYWNIEGYVVTLIRVLIVRERGQNCAKGGGKSKPLTPTQITNITKQKPR